MEEVKAVFNVEDFENYGESGTFLSEDQQEQVSLVEGRVNSQLDWLAQLLGWNGPNYWGSLASTVYQKRQILGGSFGAYNSFLYPEVVEIRNWESVVVIKSDDRILSRPTFFLGSGSYTPSDIKSEEDNFILTFDTLPDQFYSDIAAGEQLKVICPLAQPSPFARPKPGTSADASFLCKIDGSSIVLHPEYDTQFALPYIYNVFVKGARYYFDKPVSLVISSSLTINPEYSFAREQWYINVPVDSATTEVGLTGVLILGSSTLEVSLLDWQDPSDWQDKNTLENFRGVWNNKGGRLPFNFVFDSLGLHGFDERNSVYTGQIERSISFDKLLDFVYFQKAFVSPSVPSGSQTSQIWWNSQNGTFSVYEGDLLNCGPWVEVNYPEYTITSINTDYVFPDVESFASYTEVIPVGNVVRILDITGLGPSEEIVGLRQVLSGPGSVEIYQEEGSEYWTPLRFIFDDVSDFSANSELLPSKVVVTVEDSNGLSSEGLTYKVNNLKFNITEHLPLNLMKGFPEDTWFLSPPSKLKYIGNTRLFNSPANGELNWDFSEENPEDRSARMFYYNRWYVDPLTEELSLEGDWISVNGPPPSSPVSEVVNFDAVRVYCNNNILNEGVPFRTDSFQLSYSVNETTGNFEFLYIPIDYKGIWSFPRVTISDSLTSAFVYDISEIVFSGVNYYMSPNVKDSETLLRVWKSESLRVIDSLNSMELLRNSNPLRADINSGPGDDNWERYFFRLPPSYQRQGAAWQKVNLVCQDFGYWGSSQYPETMECQSQEGSPRVYESVYLNGERPDKPSIIYSEPYLFSGIEFGYSVSDDFENSSILPSFDQPFDDFQEAEIISYDPLHNRQADVSSPVGRGYGEWEGGYYKAGSCSELSGFLVNDLLSGNLEPIAPPIWDSSIYKAPVSCLKDRPSYTVDSNHYKIGYAFFAADLSAAEEGVFDLRPV